MSKYNKRFSFFDGVMALFTGGLWFIPVIFRNRNRGTTKVKKYNTPYTQHTALNYLPIHRYPYVDTSKKSRIVSLFTKKWYEAASQEFIVLDLETTGLNKTIDSIVEVAALRYVDGVFVDKFVTLVNPQTPIPYDATAVHGISDSKVMRAPTIENVLPQLLNYIDGRLIVGHNTNFDVGFLEVWSRRLGYDPYWDFIDTISVSKKLIPGLINYKQQTILDAIGYRQSSYHRAEDDCKGCAEIMILALDSLYGTF